MRGGGQLLSAIYIGKCSDNCYQIYSIVVFSQTITFYQNEILLMSVCVGSGEKNGFLSAKQLLVLMKRVKCFQEIGVKLRLSEIIGSRQIERWGYNEVCGEVINRYNDWFKLCTLPIKTAQDTLLIFSFFHKFHVRYQKLPTQNNYVSSDKVSTTFTN